MLDELGPTRLVTSIPGVSAVGAAAILAQTGDPRGFPRARGLVKRAGLAPREKHERMMRRWFACRIGVRLAGFGRG